MGLVCIRIGSPVPSADVKALAEEVGANNGCIIKRHLLEPETEDEACGT